MPFALNEQSTFWARKRRLAGLVLLGSCLGVAFWFLRRSQPGPVVKGVKISAIASHSAVLKPDGSLWAWMDNTLFFDSTPSLGIGLPGHFICRYQSLTEEVYIDCFRKGKFWTKGDCVRYLLQTNHTLQEGHMAPVSSRRILLRMCANLHQTYSCLEMRDEASRIQRYLVALAK